MTTPVKAKRRLTDIKFDHEGAAVALVGVHQGGPANGVPTLLTKALNVSEELVDKAAEVTVELSMVDFLRKFFGMYWEDSQVLATALGYGSDSSNDWIDGETYKEYIDRKASSISVMKSVYKAPDVNKALSELPPEQLVALKQDQEILEKAMSSASEDGESLKTESNPNEDDMDKIEKALHEELLATAVKQAEDVLKATLTAKETELAKALEKVAEFEKAAGEAKVAARVAALVKAGKPEERAVALEKSMRELSDEAFAEIVADFTQAATIEKNADLFNDQGVDGAGAAPVEVDKTLEILKAKYAPK